MALLDLIFKTKAVREDKRSSRLIRQDNKMQARTSNSTLCKACSKHFVPHSKKCQGCGTWCKIPQKAY